MNIFSYSNTEDSEIIDICPKENTSLIIDIQKINDIKYLKLYHIDNRKQTYDIEIEKGIVKTDNKLFSNKYVIKKNFVIIYNKEEHIEVNNKETIKVNNAIEELKGDDTNLNDYIKTKLKIKDENYFKYTNYLIKTLNEINNDTLLSDNGENIQIRDARLKFVNEPRDNNHNIYILKNINDNYSLYNYKYYDSSNIKKDNIYLITTITKINDIKSKIDEINEVIKIYMNNQLEYVNLNKFFFLEIGVQNLKITLKQ